MSTLLLRFAAPLQSWGHESKFERRATGREPTKSGVIGFLAAALGRRRTDSVKDLAGLKFGVLIIKPGQTMRDYHIAASSKRTYVTHRYYLEDADFLVGLEGDSEFLGELEAAVLSPYFPLFLGRRSCPPTGRVCLGLRDAGLKDALISEPFHSSGDIKLMLDSDEVGYHRQRDLPVSFDMRHRKFAYRYLKFESEKPQNKAPLIAETLHDPFSEVAE